MREINRFQMNVAVVTQNLRARKKLEDPAVECEKVWKKFYETRQEPVRLATALWGFFEEETTAEHQQQYTIYLKKHVRNAVEALIEEDDPEKILKIEELGWFGKTELEGFIQIANERQKSQSLVALMNLKNRKYGYQEDSFDL